MMEKQMNKPKKQPIKNSAVVDLSLKPRRNIASNGRGPFFIKNPSLEYKEIRKAIDRLSRNY